MLEYYLGIRFVTYSILFALTLYLLFKNGTRVVFLLFAFVLLCITTELLDEFVITSNLELSSIYIFFEFVIVLLLVAPYLKKKVFSISALLLLLISTIMAFFSTVHFQFLNSEVIMETDYGFIDTYESNLLKVLQIFLIVPLLFTGIYKVIAKPTKDSQALLLFFCFALLVSKSGRFFMILLGNYALVDPQLYISIAGVVFPWVFILSKGLILTGLLWKKSE
jgi:hypothetical protein